MSQTIDNVGARDREADVFDRIEAFRRRKPRLLDEVVTLAHGAGGKASAALLESVFVPAFAIDPLAALTDAAVLALPSGDRLAFSTDSFVVKPLRFPGGSIGELAVNGTVNDLAVSGARPLALSLSLILEEGLPAEELRAEVDAIARAATAAGEGRSIVALDATAKGGTVSRIVPEAARVTALRTDVDVVVVREGKNFKGRALAIVVGIIGKRMLEKQLSKTVKAIEARNDRG